MGDRAATPCDRSLGCEATPSTYPAGYDLLVARGIGLASVHDSRAERFLPGPDGHVPFSFPRFATHRLARTTLLLCGMFACGAASIDPRTIKAPGTCSALWSAWRPQCAVCAQAHLTEDGLSPGCSARVARTDEQHRWLLRTMGCLGCYLSRIS